MLQPNSRSTRTILPDHRWHAGEVELVCAVPGECALSRGKERRADEAGLSPEPDRRPDGLSRGSPRTRACCRCSASTGWSRPSCPHGSTCAEVAHQLDDRAAVAVDDQLSARSTQMPSAASVPRVKYGRHVALFAEVPRVTEDVGGVVATGRQRGRRGDQRTGVDRWMRSGRAAGDHEGADGKTNDSCDAQRAAFHFRSPQPGPLRYRHLREVREGASLLEQSTQRGDLASSTSFNTLVRATFSRSSCCRDCCS